MLPPVPGSVEGDAVAVASVPVSLVAAVVAAAVAALVASVVAAAVAALVAAVVAAAVAALVAADVAALVAAIVAAAVPAVVAAAVACCTGAPGAPALTDWASMRMSAIIPTTAVPTSVNRRIDFSFFFPLVELRLLATHGFLSKKYARFLARWTFTLALCSWHVWHNINSDGN